MHPKKGPYRFVARLEHDEENALARALYQFDQFLNIDLAAQLGEPTIDSGCAERDTAFWTVVGVQKGLSEPVAGALEKLEVGLETRGQLEIFDQDILLTIPIAVEASE